MTEKKESYLAGKNPLTIQGVELANLVEIQQVVPQVNLSGKRLKTAKAVPLAEETSVFVFEATMPALGIDAISVKGFVENQKKEIFLQIAEDNFTFDQLFKDFNCQNLADYIFDDVSLQLQEQEEGEVNYYTSFMGKLRLDTAPLETIKDFLGIEDGVVVTGKIETKDADITDLINPVSLTLESNADLFVSIFDGTFLKSGKLVLKLIKDEETQKWKFETSITANIETTRLGTLEAITLSTEIKYGEDGFECIGELSEAKGLFGYEKLQLNNVVAKMLLGAESKQFLLNADFNPNEELNFQLQGILSSEYAALKVAADKFSLNDLKEVYSSLTGDTLDEGEVNPEFEESYISLATQACELEGEQVPMGISVGTKLKVYETSGKVAAVISSEGLTFSGKIEDVEIGSLEIKEVNLSVDLCSSSSKKSSKVELKGLTVIEGMELACKVSYEKSDENEAVAVVSASLDALSFGMSSLFPSTKNTFVDALRFKKVAFVYATEDSEVKDEDFNFEVKKGVQLLGVLEKIEQLSQLTRKNTSGLLLRAYFGTTTEISMEVADMQLDLGDSVVCDELKIGIEILPNPSFKLLFGMEVIVPKQEENLHFDVQLEIGTIEAKGSGTMNGYWQDPFDVKGLAIGPQLALELGINYPQFVSTGLPSEFGFVGGLRMGEIIAKMALKISENPANQILLGDVEKLNPKNLVSFANVLTGMNIDTEQVPNFFDMEKLKMYCAPNGGSIGTIQFDPGFTFSADLILFEKKLSVYTRFNDDGVIAKGELDEFELGPLKVSGKNGGKAKLDLELTKEKQSVLIDGKIDLLGMSQGIFLDISNKGAKFDWEQNLFNALKVKVQAETEGVLSDIENLDFRLYGEFESNVSEYLKTTVVQKINDARKAVASSIDEAQAKVDEAERVYKAAYEPLQRALEKAQADAEAYLKNCVDGLKNTKAEWNTKIDEAQRKLNDAKTAYDNALQAAINDVANAERVYNDGIRVAQDEVNRARDVYNRAMDEAQRAVDDAIRDYDNSFGQAERDLQNARNAVNSLQHEINDAQRELNNASWYETHKHIYYSAKISGLWIAKNTADGVLATCQAIVDGFQHSTVFIARQTAWNTLELVQRGTEFTAFTAANAALETAKHGANYTAFLGAKSTLEAVRYGSEYTIWQGAQQTLELVRNSGDAAINTAQFTLDNVGASLVYVTLKSAQFAVEQVKNGTAALAFQTAKGVLEATKHGVEGMLVLGTYIAKNIGNIFDIQKITILASLKGIKQGKLFVLTLKGKVFGQQFDIVIDLDLTKMAEFVEELFKKVLDRAKEIALVG